MKYDIRKTKVGIRIIDPNTQKSFFISEVIVQEFLRLNIMQQIKVENQIIEIAMNKD